MAVQKTVSTNVYLVLAFARIPPAVPSIASCISAGPAPRPCVPTRASTRGAQTACLNINPFVCNGLPQVDPPAIRLRLGNILQAWQKAHVHDHVNRGGPARAETGPKQRKEACSWRTPSLRLPSRAA